MNKPIKELIISIITVLLILNIATNVSAEPPVEVSVIVPSDVYVGNPFDIAIHVDPNGTDIAGMQLNFKYDAQSIVINNITEGELFTQGDLYDTFFVDGTYGYCIIEDIYSTILGPHSISTRGYFITINAVAISPGDKSFELTNVKIVSPEGTIIDNIVFDTVMIATEYPIYDLNKDGIVDIADLTIVAQHFGLTI